MTLRERLRDFGTKYGFIPSTKESLRDDFGYVDFRLRDVVYRVKGEIEDYFIRKESVIPFHWHKVKDFLARLPKRFLGLYSRSQRGVYISQEVLDDQEQLKYVTKHELFHSLQDELGILQNEPAWKYEAEASIVAMDDFENVDFDRTDNFFGYSSWTLSYVWSWGKTLMSSFREKMERVYDYFSEDELA